MASYTYEEVSPHPDRRGGIPCKCCRLDNGLDLPVPQDLTMKQIQTHAASFSHSILSDWTQLNAILKRFEATIRKRWLKKSAKQRRDLLLKVRPTIPHVHRPDFEGFRNQGNSRVSMRSLAVLMRTSPRTSTWRICNKVTTFCCSSTRAAATHQYSLPPRMQARLISGMAGQKSLTRKVLLCCCPSV